jgi:hypothetical protein
MDAFMEESMRGEEQALSHRMNGPARRVKPLGAGAQSAVSLKNGGDRVLRRRGAVHRLPTVAADTNGDTHSRGDANGGCVR